MAERVEVVGRALVHGANPQIGQLRRRGAVAARIRAESLRQLPLVAQGLEALMLLCDRSRARIRLLSRCS